MVKQRQFSPMKGIMPNPDEIFCRDCAFRDKTTVKIGDKIIQCGITKAYCDIYVEPNSKPSKVLFQDAPCDYWEKDSEV